MITTVLLRAAVSLALGAAPAPFDVRRPLDVLHAWDQARSSAYSHGDAAGLRRLYLPGSSAGAADVALLQRYSAHGYRVVVLRPQVFSVDVLDQGRDRIRLRLVDRVTGAVMGHGRCALLPADPPRERTVELRRWAGAWRVAAVGVRDAGPGPRR